jgi:type II secretory pathway pseudopilin PulG
MVSLAIVGILAVLTIPSLFNNVQEAQNLTKLKQTMAQLSQVVQQGTASRKLYAGVTKDDVFTYFKSKLNTVQSSPPTVNACPGLWGYGADQAGCMTLSNGAVIQFNQITANVGTGEGYMDVNGATGPNVDGKDRLVFGYYSGTAPTGYTNGCITAAKPGELRICDNHKASAEGTLGVGKSNYTKLAG